jgi:hypothetical protein
MREGFWLTKRAEAVVHKDRDNDKVAKIPSTRAERVITIKRSFPSG